MPLAPRGETQRFVPFGNYLLDELIAEGGMAKVYRARLRGIGGFEKPLVVKLIHDHLGQDPAFIDLFVQEAHTLVRLGHPHIVTVYELGIVDGTYFIAMDRIEGAPLSDLRQGGPLDPKEAAHIVAQVADALSYAHDRHGLVHRDITPRNILIDDTGHTHLVDFGIAAPQGQSAAFGSPGYVAPELLEGQGASPQSDLFSLGVVLARCLGDVSEGPLRCLAERLQSPKPSGRPKNAKAVAEEVRRWLAEAAPEGAAPLLAARVQEQRAQDQRGQKQQAQGPVSPSADGTKSITPHTPVATPSPDSSNHTQSLATSPLLDLGITEALPRASTANGASPDSRSSHSRSSTPQNDTTEPLAGATPPEQRHRRWAIAALLLIAFGALAFYRSAELQSSGESQPSGESRPSGGSQPSDESQPSGESRTSSPDDQTPAPPSERLSVAPTDPTGAQPIAEESDPRRNEAEAEAVAEPAPEQRPARGRESVPQTLPQAPQPSPPRPETASAEAASPQTPIQEARRPATLNVLARPWADVRIDGRPLGPTPLRNIEVQPGRHSLQLHCPPFDREASIPFEAEAGAVLQITAALDRDPPTIRIRPQ